MKFAEDFRREAREALRYNWGKAVGIGFVASLLGAGIFAYTGDTNVIFYINYIRMLSVFSKTDYYAFDEVLQSEDVGLIYVTLFMMMGMSLLISFIIFVFHLTIGSAVTLGYCKYNLNLIDKNGKAACGNLFEEFARIGRAIGMQFFRVLFTYLWSLLLFGIPGLIKYYSYSMAAYIMYEDSSLSATEAITKSRELMDGNKWRLFCLHFSFIGWSFLCLFTCGIGYLWLYPYQEAARAAFYREIWREKYGEPDVVTVAETEAAPVTAGTSYEDMIAGRYREPEYKDEN